uniref:Uncharacterized protein n=1 Tax=Aplanochytrium stocchinoi TaxID=215587 RepID=A0A7S3UY16_9STRA|mmetsp:Transcript_34598/g.42655  ORF Transcript_34598/g.42655 Transcript_34598/m.42655 type:complete len:278 (+) Transcript_34598:250-1083(+)
MDSEYMGERAAYSGLKIRRSENDAKVPDTDDLPSLRQRIDKHSLYISQVPYSVTKEQLAQLFEASGCSVKSCRIVTTGGNGSGKSKGVAFIDCDDAESYQNGLKLHRSKFHDRKLNVRPTLTHNELAEKVKAREEKIAEVFAKKEDESNVQGNPRKRKIGVCFAFQKGKCERGQGCKFLHTKEEKVEKPTKSIKPNSIEGKDVVCRDFRKGTCERGDKCKFVHTTTKQSTKQQTQGGNTTKSKKRKSPKAQKANFTKAERSKRAAIIRARVKKGRKS